MLRVLLVCILSLCLQSTCVAKERLGLEDRLIATTFKALAKAFVATADIEKLKQANIKKLRDMPEEEFRNKYLDIYAVMKDLPFRFKAKYGLSEKLDREQAIKEIESLNRKKAYGIIEDVPDALVVSEFKRYLKERSLSVGNNLTSQIRKIWEKITAKLSFSKALLPQKVEHRPIL